MNAFTILRIHARPKGRLVKIYKGTIAVYVHQEKI